MANHEHTFCPHCNPCRQAARMVELEGVLRSLASYVGNGGYNAPDPINVVEFEAKIREGIDSLARIERSRAILIDPKAALAAIESVCATIHPDLEGHFDKISDAIADTREVLHQESER